MDFLEKFFIKRKTIKFSFILYFFTLVTLLVAFYKISLLSFIYSILLSFIFSFVDFYLTNSRNILANVILLIPKAIFIGLLFFIQFIFLFHSGVSEAISIIISSFLMFINIYFNLIISSIFKVKIKINYSRLLQALFFVPIFIYFYFAKTGNAQIFQFDSSEVDTLIFTLLIIHSVISLLETLILELMKSEGNSQPENMINLEKTLYSKVLISTVSRSFYRNRHKSGK